MKHCSTGSLNGKQPEASLLSTQRRKRGADSVSVPMTEDVAPCFGLEIARILLASSFRDFQMARYESEKRMIQQVDDRLTGDSWR